MSSAHKLVNSDMRIPVPYSNSINALSRCGRSLASVASMRARTDSYGSAFGSLRGMETGWISTAGFATVQFSATQNLWKPRTDTTVLAALAALRASVSDVAKSLIAFASISSSRTRPCF